MFVNSLKHSFRTSSAGIKCERGEGEGEREREREREERGVGEC